MGVRAMRFYLSASTPDVLFYGQVLVLGIACGLLSILVCYTFSGVRAGAGAAVSQPLSPGGGGERRCHGSHLNFGHKTYLGTGEALIAQAIDQGRAAPQDCFLKLLLTALTLGAGLKGAKLCPALPLGPPLAVWWVPCWGCRHPMLRLLAWLPSSAG